MIGVMIVPTGIGAEIGGHAGDANPVAKLIASVCDTLILHPNVVNASDINEMPENSLYVEGSALDKFLRGDLVLTPVKRPNKILLVVNAPVHPTTINSINAARTTIGADIEIVELNTPLQMIAEKCSNGMATGRVYGHEDLIRQVNQYDFDALAVQTPIEVSEEIALDYLTNGGVNPWGGVEAVCSRMISEAIGKPCAHAPFDSNVLKNFNEVVDPRMSAEMVSVSYLHCILKGLHRAPKLEIVGSKNSLSITDVDFMISPYGLNGDPHVFCRSGGIPVIMVKENKTCYEHSTPSGAIEVENYLEAVGVIAAMNAGVTVKSVRRPIRKVNELKK